VKPTPIKIIIAGVSGSGKSTVGKLVAERMDCEFADADDFHPPQNIAKMSAGIPLDDGDRAGWLDTMGGFLAGRERVVLACSALKRVYRDRMRKHAGPLVFFVLNPKKELLRERLQGREHFMPASLLASQLATLELGDDVTVMDNSEPVEDVVEMIVAELENRDPSAPCSSQSVI
jgi:gluconokinase